MAPTASLDVEARFRQVATQLGRPAAGPGPVSEELPRRAHTQTIADLFDFPSRDAVRKWAKDHGIVGWRRGRYLLFDPRDFEASFQRQHGPTLRRVK